MGGVSHSMSGVSIPKSFGDQELDGLSLQFVTAVAEESLKTPVRFRDFSFPIGHDDSVGREFEKGAKPLFVQTNGFFRLPALGEIASDLGKADELALRIPHRGDNHVGPETGAVFSNPPALVFKLSFRSGHLQFMVGLTLLDILLGIEG